MKKARPGDQLFLPPGTPILYSPSAVVARLRKAIGFAYSKQIGWRAGLWRREANQVAERLGIRVGRPRPLVRCPSCQSWAAFLQLEGRQWACRRCASAPVGGPWVRIGMVAAYRALGIWDRHARGLRQRLALRLLELAARARTYRHLLVLAVGGAVVGPEPLNWTGPRASGPRRQREGPGTVWGPRGPEHEAPGVVHQGLAPHLVDAMIDALLHPAAYAVRIATAQVTQRGASGAAVRSVATTLPGGPRTSPGPRRAPADGGPDVV